MFSCGGDSGAQAEFACLPGKPPRVVQLANLAPTGTFNGPWRGTKITCECRSHTPKLHARPATALAAKFTDAMRSTGASAHAFRPPE